MLDVLSASCLEAIAYSLKEDIAGGDITARLIPEKDIACAQIVARETAIMAGQPWATQVFSQVDSRIDCHWLVKEGDRIESNQAIARLEGPARALVTAERTALNWLQTLSGTATAVHAFAATLAGTSTRLLDTRKTLPGLRLAQKYAVRLGGGHNHRMGLYDAYLIKENHIAACGSIAAAVNTARLKAPKLLVEVEVESFDELAEAIAVEADIALLDNFALDDLPQAVKMARGRLKLEVSGNVTQEALTSIAQAGVDYVSVGALTKHVRAIDLSMRFKPCPF